ncbi:MAG: hypothetical protein RSG77_19505 [Hafnia sp.]
MFLKNLIKALLPSFIKIPAKDAGELSQAIAHRLVRVYARGNSNLQRGHYVTAEQIEGRKKKLAQHHF